MTPEEDSFMAALVDDPEDETTRLVYADWLEEHGDDARAAFLRAEVAHFRASLEDRSNNEWYDMPGVDPVWTAMISRTGVLVPGLSFAGTGPKITRADLKLIEEHWGRPLPADYAAFMLLYNGGSPSKPYVWTHSIEEDFCDEVCFFSTRDTHTDGRPILLVNAAALVANAFGDDVSAYFEQMLPIGTLVGISDVNSDGETILALSLGDRPPLGKRLFEIEHSQSQGVSFSGNVHDKETFTELLHDLVAGP